MIGSIFSFLVHPGKGLEEQPLIRGTRLPLTGRLFEMLAGVYDRAEEDCKIEIAFIAQDGTNQQNDCRDELVQFLRGGGLNEARRLALRLQSVTTNRSGLGLLFLITGAEQDARKAVISRFPADFGVLADEDQRTLRVEFIEKVFMKNAASYKAAVYSGESLETDFWDGYVVDKQLNISAAYWINEFLMSDFKTTPAAGTKRLAEMLLNAMKTADDVNVKAEINSAARLAYNLDGEVLSIDAFCSRYNLSNGARSAITSGLRHRDLAADRFTFTVEEFEQRLPYKSIELDTGVVLTGPVREFDEIVTKERLPHDRYRLQTEGKISSETFRKRK